MIRSTRLVVAALLATASVGLSGTPALAQPANDDVAGAQVIAALPFTDTLSTVEATSSADDPDACASHATVWYRYTAVETGGLLVHTLGSDYDTVLAVYSTAFGSLDAIACNDDHGGGLASLVTFAATAGTDYLIAAGTCCGVGGAGQVGPGGTLTITVEEAPSPVEVTVALDRRGTVTRSGVVTISGTVTCSRPAHLSLDVAASQRFGRLQARSAVDADTRCVPEPTPWSVHLSSGNMVVFGPGRAEATVAAWVCDLFSCEYGEVTSRVQLRRG